MRYQVHTQALHPNGSIASGHTLTFYTDLAGTTLATLYESSTGATEVANPYTVPESGSVAFWVTTTSLYVLPQGGSIEPFNIDGNEDVREINVLDYGAVGDGAADDTSAIQQALDVAKAYGKLEYNLPQNRPVVYLPAGVYLVTGLTLDDVLNVHVRGDGRGSTTITCHGAGPVFSLGTFDSTPAHPYVGTAQGFHLTGVQIMDDQRIGGGYMDAGNLRATGIQDNGSGGVILTDCRFSGLLRGVYAPYGHDFSRYYNVDFEWNTTAVYWGPGSQQIHWFGGVCACNNRDIVMECAPQGSVYGVAFNDPKTRSIDIRRPSTLESGVTGLTDLPSELSWTFNDCWFETGAGWNLGWGPTEHVRLGVAGDPYPVRGVKFNNTRLVSGTNGMATKNPGTKYAFLNVGLGGGIEVNNILVEGAYIDTVVTSPASTYFIVTVRNYKAMDGYTPVPVFNPWTTGQRHINDLGGFERVIKGDSGSSPPTLEDSGGNAIRMQEAYGNIVWGSYLSSAWHDRLKFDMNTARLSMGFTVGTDDHSIEWGSVAPTSGAHRVGDICWNTGVTGSGGAEPNIGWCCTAAGTPGTWKTFGAVTEA